MKASLLYDFLNKIERDIDKYEKKCTTISIPLITFESAQKIYQDAENTKKEMIELEKKLFALQNKQILPEKNTFAQVCEVLGDDEPDDPICENCKKKVDEINIFLMDQWVIIIDVRKNHELFSPIQIKFHYFQQYNQI